MGAAGAGGQANAEGVAKDLIAQAEHDTAAVPILVTTSRKLADEVNAAIKTQLAAIKATETYEYNATVATQSCSKGRFVVCKDLDEACAVSNE